MAIIHRRSLFSWKNVKTKSDLDRLRLILESLPDEALMIKLENQRGKGRDDYPVRAVWNSILAGIVFQHESIESLRRELSRNGELRDLCGFDPLGGGQTVPSSHACSRFLKRLIREQGAIEKMFNSLIRELSRHLPDLGEHLAVDSKEIRTHAQSRKDPAESSDPDADWGKKEKRGVRKDGSLWEEVTSWFGYKLHLLVDSQYELPLAWKLTKASGSDTTELIPLVKDLKQRQPDLIKNAKDLSADRGYDSADNNTWLWDECKIKPLIDIREMWRDEKTKLLDGRKADNVVYDEKGQVYCFCPRTGEQRGMAYQGFEKDRECLKYRCPAAAYAMTCKGRDKCGRGSYSEYGRIVRIPLETDRRVFTPIPRSSCVWKKDYRRRSAVERVNSRIDDGYRFEKHYIRKQQKMELRFGLALVVMLAMALGHIKTGEKKKMRSLVQPRAT
jgi:hypothetical protein